MIGPHGPGRGRSLKSNYCIEMHATAQAVKYIVACEPISKSICMQHASRCLRSRHFWTDLSAARSTWSAIDRRLATVPQFNVVWNGTLNTKKYSRGSRPIVLHVAAMSASRGAVSCIEDREFPTIIQELDGIGLCSCFASSPLRSWLRSFRRLFARAMHELKLRSLLQESHQSQHCQFFPCGLITHNSES